jgi:hypothetical protein
MHRYDFSWDRKAHIRQSCRSLPRAQSLYFVKHPWTPPPVNLEGSVSYYPAERLIAMRERIAGLDRDAYLQDILDHILTDCRTDKERVTAICGFVGDSLYYNPIQQPEEPAGNQTDDHSMTGIYDAVELLELHDGRCGQGVMVTLALLEAAGIEGRKVLLDHHVSCEARYDGGWHLSDALMFGTEQPHRDGEVVSGDAIRADPYFTDAFPLKYLVPMPEETLTEDGYRALGYCFGDFGTMPFHSWYWGAPLDCPPTLPIPLVSQRLGGDRVRLNWTPSFKKGNGPVEYRLTIFADRDCTEPIFQTLTPTPSFEWEVEEWNRIYYYEVAALCDHRRLNPDTWYPALRNAFLLVPEDQYGWYGVL